MGWWCQHVFAIREFTHGRQETAKWYCHHVVFSTSFTERERICYPAPFREEAGYSHYSRTRSDGSTYCPKFDRSQPNPVKLQLHLRLGLD